MQTFQRTILTNGLKLLYHKVPRPVVTVQCTLFTGANVEDKAHYGISHFVEHMIFEGTKRWSDSQQIANIIERLGGDFNAATTSENVSYYITVPAQHWNIALQVLAEIYKHSLFSLDKVEKERGVILDEVKLIHDTPREYQWILFEKTLFECHSLKNPVYGEIPILKKLTRDDLFHYYKKYYVPRNTVVTIVGDVPDPQSAVQRLFGKLDSGMSFPLKVCSEPPQKHVVVRERKRSSSSYLVLGWKTVPASSQEMYALEVIHGILGRGQSGKLFDAVRGKEGLCYSIGSYHNYCVDAGYFAIYCATDKQRILKVVQLIRKEVASLQHLSPQELADAKSYLVGDRTLACESTLYLADKLTYWEQLTRAEDFEGYVSKIKRVSLAEVRHVAKKYLTPDYAQVVLEQM